MSACILCGSGRTTALFQASDRLFHTTTRRFAVVRCGACGLVRLDPPPSPEELRQYYPPGYWFEPTGAGNRLAEAYRRAVLRDHVRFVERALSESPASGPLLDVGSGGGLFLGMMRERGFDVAGLDFSEDAALVAWRAHQAPSFCADLERAPLRRGSVRAVTMFHVLEHVYNPAAYLRAAHDLLASQGRLIVQVPNAASWQFRLLGRAWNGIDVPRHLFDFRGRDLEKLLAACGFEVLRRKYFSLRDNPAGLATSLAPSLDPMARRVRPDAANGSPRLPKDLVYFALVLASLPFTAIEAACRAGSTIMVEARPQ
jgi:SAM-dependent methyltransferase